MTLSELIVAMGACHGDAKSRGFGRQRSRGQIECPYVKKTVLLGSLSEWTFVGRCETSGCVSWMQ